MEIHRGASLIGSLQNAYPAVLKGVASDCLRLPRMLPKRRTKRTPTAPFNHVLTGCFVRDRQLEMGKGVSRLRALPAKASQSAIPCENPTT
jgi:hypothetical protein